MGIYQQLSVEGPTKTLMQQGDVSAALRNAQCVECGSPTANIGVGFSLYDDGEGRWLFVGGTMLCMRHFGLHESVVALDRMAPRRLKRSIDLRPLEST